MPEFARARIFWGRSYDSGSAPPPGVSRFRHTETNSPRVAILTRCGRGKIRPAARAEVLWGNGVIMVPVPGTATIIALPSQKTSALRRRPVWRKSLATFAAILSRRRSGRGWPIVPRGGRQQKCSFESSRRITASPLRPKGAVRIWPGAKRVRCAKPPEGGDKRMARATGQISAGLGRASRGLQYAGTTCRGNGEDMLLQTKAWHQARRNPKAACPHGAVRHITLSHHPHPGPLPRRERQSGSLAVS